MTNNFRAYQQQQADLAEHEAWKAGKRPLPHVPHDSRFVRSYDGRGNVQLIDLETGEESRWFSVYLEDAEQEVWMGEQRRHRS